MSEIASKPNTGPNASLSQPAAKNGAGAEHDLLFASFFGGVLATGAITNPEENTTAASPIFANANPDAVPMPKILPKAKYYQKNLLNIQSKKDKIYAGLLEAVIGAIFQIKGWDYSKQFLETLFKQELKNISMRDAKKDPKTELQEYLQKYKFQLPIYDFVEDKWGKNFETINNPKFHIINLYLFFSS